MNARRLTTLSNGMLVMGGPAWGGCKLPNGSFPEEIDYVYLAIPSTPTAVCVEHTTE